MPASHGDAPPGDAPTVSPASTMMSDNGLVTVRSALALQETTARLVANLARRAIPLVARVDHAAAARSTGLAMLPAEVFIFGNPLVGTQLMQASPTMAIDLPLKILITEDLLPNCWLTYGDPLWIGRRHAVPAQQWPVLQAIRDLLASIVREVAGPDASAK